VLCVNTWYNICEHKALNTWYNISTEHNALNTWYNICEHKALNTWDNIHEHKALDCMEFTKITI